MTDHTSSTVHAGPRTMGVAALAGVAVVHLLDISSKFSETPYLGWAYVALIAGCLAAAAGIAGRDHPRAWATGGHLCVGAFAAYCLSRSVGLPAATDDIGNWAEPLGLLALAAEAIVVGATVWTVRAQPALARVSERRQPVGSTR